MNSATTSMDKEATRKEEYLELINHFAIGLLNLGRIGSANEIMWFVTENIISKLNFPDCVIYSVDEDQKYLSKKTASKNGKGTISKIIKVRIGEGIVGKVALTKKAKITNDTSLSTDYLIDEEVRLSEITVPIIYKDELMGVIDAEHPQKNFFTEEHLRILTSIASLTATKIAQARYLEKFYARQFHSDLIYNSTNDLIFLMQVEPNDVFRCLSVNEAYLKLIGLERDKIIGRTLYEIWDEERAGFFKRKYVEAIESKKPLTYEVNYGNRGSQVIVETTITPIFDGLGHCLNISGVSRNVTENKKAELSLLESEKKYKELFENSLDGIYKSTPEGKFVDVNPAMVEMLGYASKEELLAIDIKTELYFKMEDRKIMATHQEDQYMLRKKDGSGIWVEDHGHYDYDESGNILFHHGILRDVSHKMEKQNELENLLAVTEEQNKKLQNFAHIVSHNIRSHSANMSSLVHFMDRSKDEYERAKLFNMLKTSTDKLEQTIKNLNEIITVNQNLEKPKEPRNLYNEVNNTLKVLSGDIRENEISIVVDIPSSMIVKVIPAYLDSILLNIISNAIKYKSEDREPVLNIVAKKEKEFTILSVRDNGLGIDLKKNANKIFGMYETFHDNEDSRGFGLYITKNQIEAMDGKIEVESELNKGSEFKIYFNNAD